ncbi:CobW/HypB/UreG [Lasiosphaeris hirsuta]|uniref:CobW/HypB/UreG n=1 Tax=Lasiosphaeris hirsuta TaxID=260670 RepID=A0AA40DXI0_9PEZI|nr:CobW/HypB/UreG [Lasiosphaeris hirsuta]
MATPTGASTPSAPTTTDSKGPIPITIVTGFLGSGKTTLILNLLPQLRAANPAYRLALLKNEFGDVAVDSQLAASGTISGVQELLNGCICCNLVGQLSTALAELRATVAPDRIVVETSGSAFPATLALEVNRLARETSGAYALDGVVSVVDVENWKGYEDTSYTARLQARYTDLIVFNKWEGCGERRFDECLDRLGDLELDTPWVRSDKGWVSMDLVLGIDGGLARGLGEHVIEGHDHEHKESHNHDHQSEVELHTLLKTAPREEVYRIKAVFSAAGTVRNSDEDTGIPTPPSDGPLHSRYILNWAFGRWTFTPVGADVKEHESSSDSALRMTMILARYESTKWKKRLETAGFLALDGDGEAELSVTKII